MRFRIGDRDFTAEFWDEGAVCSKHTGRVLRQARISLAVRGTQANEHFLQIFNSARADGLYSCDDEGAITAKWKVSNNSYSNTSGSDVYHHSLHLEEQEELNIEELVINDLHLHPYAYSEEFASEDTLTITARVELPMEAVARLRALIADSDYVRVIRTGINDEERQMRFGNDALWSEHADLIKQQFVLIDRSTRDVEPKQNFLSQVENSAARRLLATVAESFDSLLEVLRRKSLLTEEEVKELKEVERDRFIGRVFEFHHVNDLDEWKLL